MSPRGRKARISAKGWTLAETYVAGPAFAGSDNTHSHSDSMSWRLSTERFPDPFRKGSLDLGGESWTADLSKRTQALSVVDSGQQIRNQ